MSAVAPVTAVAASMDLTAAAMSQCAERMSESSNAVKDFDASFTTPIVPSNKSGAGNAATAITIAGQIRKMITHRVSIRLGLIHGWVHATNKNLPRSIL